MNMADNHLNEKINLQSLKDLDKIFLDCSVLPSALLDQFLNIKIYLGYKTTFLDTSSFSHLLIVTPANSCDSDID